MRNGNNSVHSPVIIIGMHRSGTGMLCRMLEKLGIFAGRKKQHNHEALFFLKMNDWLLRQSGASWDHPEPFHLLLENKEIKTLAVDYIQHIIKTPIVISFLGWRRYVRYRDLVSLDFPWAWKDPRNTYTLPIWLELFPDAKVIHIYRNGVDVANSLKVRQEKNLVYKKARYLRAKEFYWLRPKQDGFTDSIRSASLEGGFTLWEEYIQEAKRHVIALGFRAFELRYEDLLAEPYKLLQQLAHFCNLKADDAEIQRVSGLVKMDQADTSKHEPELQAFARKVARQLAVQGY